MKRIGEVVEPGNRDTVDAFLVFLDLLVRHFKGFSELLLVISRRMRQRRIPADENVDGLRRPGIVRHFLFLGNPRFL